MSEDFLNIVVFAYKRPYRILNCIAAIKRNQLSAEARLIICIDGLKSNASHKDITGHLKTIEVANTTEGFKEVEVIVNSANLGLVKQFFLTFDRLFNLADNWVVVEDDIEVSTTFLQYLKDAFHLFGTKKDISLIHGYTYYIPSFEKKNSSYFSVGSGNKAFGITKTFWKNVERNADYYVEMKGNKKLRKELMRKNIDYKALNIESIESNYIPAWDCILALNAKHKRLLCLSPDNSLAKDLGWDTDASNTFGENFFEGDYYDSYYQITNFPKEVICDKQKEKQIKFYFRYTLRFNFWTRKLKILHVLLPGKLNKSHK